jgi:ankyrin repeat protein
MQAALAAGAPAGGQFHNDPPLTMVAEKGNLAGFRLLLSAGANPTALRWSYRSVVSAALHSGSGEMVRVAMAAREAVRPLLAPIHVAAAAGDDGASVRALLAATAAGAGAPEASALANTAGLRPDQDIRPLDVAVAVGDVGAVAALCGAGVQLVGEYRKFRSCVFLAAELNRAAALQLLLDAASAAAAKGDEMAVRSLHVQCNELAQTAAGYGSADALKVLLARGASATHYVLRAAARNGYVECVQMALDAGAPARGDGGSTEALAAASRTGALAVVRLLLKAGAPVQSMERETQPLHEAVFGGHTAVVAELLAAGARLEARDDRGNTALHHAATADGGLEAVRVLLAAGARLDAVDSYQCDPLAAACAVRHGTAAVRELLAAAPTSPGGDKLKTTRACINAVKCDAAESLAAVMAHGKAVGLPLASEQVAMLLEACASGASLKCLELLLREGGAALLAPASQGKRAGGGTAAVDGGALLESAVRGCCPFIHQLWSAVRLSRGARTVSLLLATGARLTAKQEAALLPVHVMAHAGTAGEAAVSALVAAGADPRRTGDRGVTALHCAAASGHAPLVRLLVGYGVPVGARDGAGRTALHWASRADRGAAVRELARAAGAPADVVDAVDRRAWTALHDAASTCATDAVGALLECGADATARNGAGLTPVDVVRAWMHEKLLLRGVPQGGGAADGGGFDVGDGGGVAMENVDQGEVNEEADDDSEEWEDELDEEWEEVDGSEVGEAALAEHKDMQTEWADLPFQESQARMTAPRYVDLLGVLQAAAAWRRRRPAVLCDPYALADLPDEAGSEAVGGKRRRGDGGAEGGGKRGRR